MSYCYDYPRPALTTDAIVFCREKQTIYILLIERGIEPFKNYWALPGGFVHMDEDLETACARELEEETGLRNLKLKQLAAFGAVDRDPRGRTVSVVFWSEIQQLLVTEAGDDASEAAWFPIDELPPLAFDHHIIIQYFKSALSL